MSDVSPDSIQDTGIAEYPPEVIIPSLAMALINVTKYCYSQGMGLVVLWSSRDRLVYPRTSSEFSSMVTASMVNQFDSFVQRCVKTGKLRMIRKNGPKESPIVSWPFGSTQS